MKPSSCRNANLLTGGVSRLELVRQAESEHYNGANDPKICGKHFIQAALLCSASK
jgi:hypothetical protein